jgi:phenylalanyl-tRNA synthetase beta chain
MAASLLAQFGGRVCEQLLDVFPLPPKKKGIVLRHRRIADLLGVDVDKDFIQQTLQDLEFGLELQQPGVWQVKIPTWRVDINREADLIEEVARFFGYERIPSVLPPLQIVDPIPDQIRERAKQIRPLLFHYGFNEVINFSFSDAERERLFASGLEPVEIRNPISARASLLRTTLLGGLLETAAWNRNRGLEAVQVFEMGKVYFREDQDFRERLALGLLSTGMRGEPHWRTRSGEADFFQLKGECEALLRQLRYEPFSFERNEHPFFEPGSCLAVAFKEEKIGCLGRVAGRMREAFDLKQEVWVAEIDLDLLFGKQPRPFVYQPVAKYPGIIRDVSLLVPRGVAYQDIQKAIEKLPLPILEEVQLIDRYSGESIPQDKISLSFRFIYRHLQRTLLAEEVDKAEQQVLNQLKRIFGVQLREGGKIDNRTGKN